MKMKMKMAKGNPSIGRLSTMIGCFFLIILGWLGSNYLFPVDRNTTEYEGSNPVKTRAVTRDITHSISKARSKAKQALNIIHQRYEFDNPYWFRLFLMIYNMPDYTWHLLQYSLAMKILRGHQQESIQEMFRMVFVGTSVTAGYENYYNQTYVAILDKHMRAALSEVGLELDVRNIGQRRMNCRLQAYCFKSQLEIDEIDILGYENTYGCGRDKDIFELLARLAYDYKAVLFVAASGGLSPTYCALSKDPVPWISEDWQPNQTSILDDSFNISAVWKYRSLLHQWHADSNSVGKFTQHLNNDYKGAGIHGFSMWSKSQSLCSYSDEEGVKKTEGCVASDFFSSLCYNKGGPHFMTREAALRGSDGQLAKAWNPSRGMHLLRGEVMAYSYLMILLDALNMIERGIKDHDMDALLKKYVKEFENLRGTIPTSMQFCNSSTSTKLSPVDCDNSSPRCYSQYLPSFTLPKSGLLNVTVGVPVVWEMEEIPISLQDSKKYGYLDRKYYLRGVLGGNPLHLKILGAQKGVVKLYGLGGEKSNLRGVHIILDPHVPNLLDAKTYTASKKIVLIKDQAVYDRKSDSYVITGIPKGDHVLTLLTPMDSKQSENSALTHLVVY